MCIVVGTTFTNLVNGAGTGATMPSTVGDASATWAFTMLCEAGSAAWNTLTRGILIFDTTLLQDNIHISEATIRIYGLAKQDSGGDSPTVNIYEVDSTYTGKIIKEDFITFGTTPFSSDLAYADMTTTAGTYNDFVLNSDGIKYIKKRNVTKFGLRESTYDVTDTDPGAVAGKDIYWAINNEWATKYLKDSRGPQLIIKYSRINTTFI